MILFRVKFLMLWMKILDYVLYFFWNRCASGKCCPRVKKSVCRLYNDVLQDMSIIIIIKLIIIIDM